MAIVYKVHPAIGVARVGNHLNAFFIGPEVPGSAGVEIAADGAENPISSYKDQGRSNGRQHGFACSDSTRTLLGH